MPGGFNANTRRRLIQLPTLTKASGGGVVSINPIPRNGFLARLYLVIRGTVAGSLSNANALGMASIVKRVQLSVNNSQDIFRLSGAQYHYLFRDFVESEYVDVGGDSNGRSAVTATTFNLDMVIPIAMDLRDPIGILLNQNEQMTLSLDVDFEADATVATGATVTCTVIPVMEVFTVPPLEEDWPPVNLLHTVLGESTSVAASGEFRYTWPRGNVYLQLIHGLGIGASASDGWSQYILQVNHGDNLETFVPTFADRLHYHQKGRARPAGVIHFDFLGSSGLGNYGLMREPFNSRLVTDLQTVITATGAATLYTVRRELVQLAPAA